jgi:ribosomal protein S18 acetylase RimI-like enzyme
VSRAIRPATNEDLEICLQMNGDCVTDHVWQLAQKDRPDQIVAILTDVRLPRETVAEYPRKPSDIIEMWESVDVVMVAEMFGTVCGFVDIRAEPWHDTAWISNLIVAQPHRRRGIGTELIHAANEWAAQRHLRTVMVETQSQNWPTTRFYQKLGFSFAGFTDHYYVNQIALFFARPAR